MDPLRRDPAALKDKGIISDDEFKRPERRAAL